MVRMSWREIGKQESVGIGDTVCRRNQSLIKKRLTDKLAFEQKPVSKH